MAATEHIRVPPSATIESGGVHLRVYFMIGSLNCQLFLEWKYWMLLLALYHYHYYVVVAGS